LTAPPIPASRTRRDLLRFVAEGTAGVVGDAFLRSLVTHLAGAFRADAAFVAELVGAGRARTLASFTTPEIHLPEGYEFALAGTPCAVAYADGEVRCPAGAPARWPQDRLIGGHGLEGYIAVALVGADATQIGHIGVMARERLDASADEMAVLRIFAARAAAEIERRWQESILRQREAELAAQRARVVQAADEERRRIGRDLHDGAQQRLVALGQYIDLARRKATTAPGEADRMLELAREQVTLAGSELRDLARGLHPIALERGLEVALASLAMQSTLRLEVEALPDRRLPEVVEATIWFVVSEALSNAVKHAGATEVRVRVLQEGRCAHVCVRDDGTGGASLDEGTGLLGLTARIEALGGTLAVDSPPGAGTRLEARIPLAPWRSAREPFLEVGHPDDGGEGERTIADIEAGRKRVSVTLAREWELEGGLPRIGRRMPVIDHHGVRRATVEIERVALVPFADVGPDVVPLEATGAVSHEAWRERQKAFYDRCREEVAVLLEEPGWWLTDEEPMAVVWFRAVDEQPPA
jgi:signal transduction histidine kinase/uncharacterized protein YhfF